LNKHLEAQPYHLQVRYDVIGRGTAVKYFVIDPDSGVLRVRDDLRKLTDTEFQIDVRAYDLGEPQLSSVSTVPVHVRHVALLSGELGFGFAEDSYNVDVPEDATPGTLIKILSVISGGPRDGSAGLECHVASGNEQRHFAANMTEERNCALWLDKAELDFEDTESYQIKIKLGAVVGTIKGGRNVTMVRNLPDPLRYP
jgi:protocadherin-15